MRMVSPSCITHRAQTCPHRWGGCYGWADESSRQHLTPSLRAWLPPLGSTFTTFHTGVDFRAASPKTVLRMPRMSPWRLPVILKVAPLPFPGGDLQSGNKCSSNLWLFICVHPADAAVHILTCLGVSASSHSGSLSSPSPNPHFLFACVGGWASVCTAHHGSLEVFRAGSCTHRSWIEVRC